MRASPALFSAGKHLSQKYFCLSQREKWKLFLTSRETYQASCCCTWMGRHNNKTQATEAFFGLYQLKIRCYPHHLDHWQKTSSNNVQIQIPAELGCLTSDVPAFTGQQSCNCAIAHGVSTALHARVKFLLAFSSCYVLRLLQWPSKNKWQPRQKIRALCNAPSLQNLLLDAHADAV